MNWAHILAVFHITCHRHLEKHKEETLNQTHEMCFPPVTTANVCFPFTVCVFVQAETTREGFPRAGPEGGGLLGCERFSSAVITKKRSHTTFCIHIYMQHHKSQQIPHTSTTSSSRRNLSSLLKLSHLHPRKNILCRRGSWQISVHHKCDFAAVQYS